MHVATELHDGPIQRLAVLSYDLERAKQRMLGNPAVVARVAAPPLAAAGRRRRRLDLEIRDDGVGFEPVASSALVRDGRFGLVAMQERVEMAPWVAWSPSARRRYGSLPLDAHRDRQPRRVP